MINITPIRALQDNYIWAIHSPENCNITIVDPGDAAPVISYLSNNNLSLGSILITHHHADHTAGIVPLTTQFPKIPVYGPKHEDIHGVTHPLQEGDKISILNGALSLSILDIPGHTRGHIAYYSNEFVFCGDTLFSCGCGKIFEGTPHQMFASLNKLKSLPEHTLVYCAHEYTLANIAFAKQVDPSNGDLESRYQEALIAQQQGIPSLPSRLKTELKTNPFLRCDAPAIKHAVSEKFRLTPPTEVEIFAHLREWKNKLIT